MSFFSQRVKIIKRIGFIVLNVGNGIAIAEEQNFPITALPSNFMVATAIRLSRALTA